MAGDGLELIADATGGRAIVLSISPSLVSGRRGQGDAENRLEIGTYRHAHVPARDTHAAFQGRKVVDCILV